MDMRVFAERLKKARTEKNISAVELSEAICVNVGTIHRWEKAEFKSIKEDRLDSIANYLGVNKDYLIGKTDEKYNLDVLKDLSKKEKLEINSIIYITKDILKEDRVVIDDIPLSKEDIQYINYALEVTIEMIKKKIKNKK